VRSRPSLHKAGRTHHVADQVKRPSEPVVSGIEDAEVDGTRDYRNGAGELVVPQDQRAERLTENARRNGSCQ
jgi:hypothetical protein